VEVGGPPGALAGNTAASDRRRANLTQSTKCRVRTRSSSGKPSVFICLEPSTAPSPGRPQRHAARCETNHNVGVPRRFAQGEPAPGRARAP
jgi:hypothetical protein